MSTIDIDTPDFDQALQTSRDGAFQRAVLAYLQSAATDLHGKLQRGLSPTEFAEAEKIAAAIQKAGDVIRFSSRTHHS